MPSLRSQRSSKQRKLPGKKSQEDEQLDSILEAYQRQAETETSKRKPVAPKTHERRPPPSAPPGFDDRWLPKAKVPAEKVSAEKLTALVPCLESDEDALYLCDLALYKDPLCSPAWYHKGILLGRSRGEFDRGRICFRRALQYDQKFLEAAKCCLVGFLELRDFDGVFSKGEEYLDLARRVSIREKRSRCLRYFLGIVVCAGTESRRFSEADGYFNELVEIVKEYPSLEALLELGQYAHGRAAWERHPRDDNGNVLLDEIDPEAPLEESVKRLVAQADSYCEQANQVSLETYMEESMRQRKAMDPYFNEVLLEVDVDDCREDFLSKMNRIAFFRAQLETEFRNKGVGAKQLEEAGAFDQAAVAYYNVDDHESAMRLVEQHAGSTELTPTQSRSFYYAGAASLFTQQLHLKTTDLHRSPAQVRRDREAFFTYCEECVAIPVEEFETGQLLDFTHLQPVGEADLEVQRLYAAAIKEIHSAALWQVVFEGIESGCAITVRECFDIGFRYLDRTKADVKEKNEFVSSFVETLSNAMKDLERGHPFGVLMRDIWKSRVPVRSYSDDDDDDDVLEALSSDATREERDRLLQNDERRLRQSVRREEDHQRTDIEESANRALLKVRWKQHVERKRASQTSTKAGHSSPASSSSEVPVCKVTAVQWREMRVLLASPAVDERAAVTVLDDEILPQRAVLFPRAVASDAVLTFMHALRPLHLHVHEIAAQLFNLSEGCGGCRPGEEPRSVTVLRRGKAAAQTIGDVLSSVIAACDRGYCSRSSGLKSFSLPMTGVPQDIDGCSGGGDVAITEVVPSKGAALRVWGFRPSKMEATRLRFVAKAGFHKPIGESYRFADCVAASAQVF